MANRISLVVAHKGEAPKVLYCGTSGAEADAAYSDAKGYDLVEFYRYPVADKRRDGAGKSREPAIRQSGQPASVPTSATAVAAPAPK